MLTLSLSSPQPLSLSNKHFHHSLKTPNHHQDSVLRLNQQRSSNFCFNPLLRVSINSREVMNTKRRGLGTVCYSAPLSPSTLQWICTASSAVLVLSRGTAIQKPFLVPLFALQAPASIISWIKGEYGIWTAFLALLVRLFYFIPGELELPFVALLLVIVAPYQVMNHRGTQEGVTLSLLIVGYLAFQHFSRLGSLRKAFEQGSIVATLSIICATAATCLLLV